LATVPISGTNIRLLSNVPFSNDYKNTRWFDTITDQTTYFTNKNVIHSMTEANFQRVEGKHFIKVDKSIDELWSTNYLMFQNTQYNAKWFYAFVTKLEYSQRNTTYVHFQIDVFQTWTFDMTFKPSFVVREHRPLWNTDGTPVINTVDEGLNYGTEYDNVKIENFQPNGGYKFLVIVSKTPMHSGATANIVKASVIGTPQPLSYYLIPFKDDDLTPTVLIGGLDSAISPPSQVLNQLYVDTKAVNNIISFYVTDYIGIQTNYSAGSGGLPDVLEFTNTENVLSSVTVGDTLEILYVEKVVDFEITLGLIDTDKYEGFETVKESKLLMHPYCLTTLDDFKGNRVDFKNEYINSPSLDLLIKGSLGTSNKVSYGIADYNYSASSLKNELSNETALINNTPSDVPIINDYLAAFLQGHKNSLQNQKSSLLFNGMMNTLGSAVGGVASAGTGNPIGVASAGLNIVQGAGSTVLQLQGIEAKQKDIGNTPPQIAKMGSNTSYDYGNNYNGVYVIKKQIKSEYRKKLADFFNLFGYKTNEVKVPNFHTRQYWNYVETTSCIITGNFNNEDLQELKSVFDSGVTFWHTDDVGNYLLDNGVI
jgi:hypothetical protein